MKKSIKSKPNKSLDLEILRQKLQKLTRQQKLYKILKEELSKKGYWKKLPRGDAKKAGLASKEKRCKNGNIK
jgi:predicted nucleic acid-binding Zn ribbon protein